MSNFPSVEGAGTYARVHQGDDAVARYFRKLANRIDALRSEEELRILRAWAQGRLYDCTIGVGRFVGRLPAVSEYSGMDLSAEFVEFVWRSHPSVPVEVADLTRGIPQPDNRFDAVMCLRSLSAIGGVAPILREMVRVARPGGVVIADYGRSPFPGLRVRGAAVPLDTEDFDGALRSLDADVVGRYRVDGVLTRLKRPRIFRFLTGPRGGMVPNALLMAAERCLAPLLWQRQIVVLRKRGA